jgi:CRISPR-associated protein Csb2
MILEIKITFTAGRYHGEEWPPSPARLFQALVAATHRDSYSLMNADARNEALRWLEQQDPPVIYAQKASRSLYSIIKYLPNNDDKIGLDAHKRSAEQSFSNYGFSGETNLSYLWSFESESEVKKYADTVAAMASLLTYLGRTTDLVVAEGKLLAESPEITQNGQVRWQPRKGNTGPWLAPAPGFLHLLQDRFPNSVSARPPDFTNSRQVDYAIENGGEASMVPPPWQVFVLRHLNGEFLTFDPTRLREISGMMRHAMITWAGDPSIQKYYGPDLLAKYISGHQAAESSEPSAGGHIAIAPLPSLDPPHYRADGRLRYVALIGYGMESDKTRELFEDLSRGLHGQPLTDQGQLQGELQLLTPRDLEYKPGLFRPLTGTSRCWRSATPIILSSLMRRGRSLEQGLLRVLKEAGFPESSIESVVAFTGPIVPTAARANQYKVNESYLKTPIRCHAEVIFHHPITGPLLLGRGKFVGFGLMIPWKSVSVSSSGSKQT